MKTTVVNLKRELCDVPIGRGTPYGNPFKIDDQTDRTEAIKKFEAWIRQQPDLKSKIEALRGKRLGCYCAPLPCHGDVWVKLIEEHDEYRKSVLQRRVPERVNSDRRQLSLPKTLDPQLAHHCHAKGCDRPVPPEMLMCKPHWALVPKNLQRAVWDAYRPGQCDDMKPSRVWHAAADAAIKAVWETELRRAELAKPVARAAAKPIIIAPKRPAGTANPAIAPTSKPLIVAVTGGRTFTDVAMVERELKKLPKGTVIVHGAARGLDSIADRVALQLGLQVRTYPAMWERDGRAAGPLRNQEMVDQEQPDRLLAFPGDDGTADMVKRCERAGIEIVEVGVEISDQPDQNDIVPADAIVAQPGAPDCANCPFSVGGRPGHPVKGVGPKNPQWIALGEGPGREENKRMIPFVGKSGALVDRALATAGVDRKQIRVTNAMWCSPDRSISDIEKERARHACRPRLLAELAEYPKIPILAMGAHAAQSLLGDKFSITKLAGSYLEITVGKEKRGVISTIHPAAILRGGDKGSGDASAPLLVYDILKVAKLAAGRMAPVDFPSLVKTEIADAPRANKLIRDMLTEIYSAKFLSWDLETAGIGDHEGKEAHFAYITVLGLGTTQRAVSVLWKLLEKSTIALVTEAFADKSIVKAGQNSTIFDQHVASRYGFRVSGKHHDTLLLHHNAFPGAPHTLQRIVTQFLIVPPWKSEFRSSEKEDPQELVDYNARDCLSAAKVVAPLQILVRKAKAEAAYETDLKMAYVAERMSNHGVPISLDENRKLDELYTPYLESALAKLRERSKDPTIYEAMIEAIAFEQAKRARKKDPARFADRVVTRSDELRKGEGWGEAGQWNPNSDEHVVGLLKAIGVKLVRETPKGAISTKESILGQYVDVAEVRAVLDLRENEKALAQYIRKIPRLVDPATQRCYPSWSVHKITKRWSVNGPELHSFSKAMERYDGKPKDNPYNQRRQIKAPVGYTLRGFDLSGAEARMIGFLSGDPFMIKTFADYDAGLAPDLHTLVTKMWFPQYDGETASKRDASRDMSKRVEYGFWYGAADQTIWLTVVAKYHEVRIQEIAKLTALLRSLQPRIPAWHEELFEQIRKTGELRGLAGRRVYPLGRFDANEVRNYCAQEGIAFLMNRGLARFYPLLRKRFKNAMPIIQHHDSLIVECRGEDGDGVDALMKECFEQELTDKEGRTMRFVISLKGGAHWSDC